MEGPLSQPPVLRIPPSVFELFASPRPSSSTSVPRTHDITSPRSVGHPRDLPNIHGPLPLSPAGPRPQSQPNARLELRYPQPINALRPSFLTSSYREDHKKRKIRADVLVEETEETEHFQKVMERPKHSGGRSEPEYAGDDEGEHKARMTPSNRKRCARNVPTTIGVSSGSRLSSPVDRKQNVRSAPTSLRPTSSSRMTSSVNRGRTPRGNAIIASPTSKPTKLLTREFVAPVPLDTLISPWTRPWLGEEVEERAQSPNFSFELAMTTAKGSGTSKENIFLRKTPMLVGTSFNPLVGDMNDGWRHGRFLNDAVPLKGEPKIYKHLCSLLMDTIHKRFNNDMRFRIPLQSHFEHLVGLDHVSSLVQSHRIRVQLVQMSSELRISDHPSVRQALQKDEQDIINVLRAILDSTVMISDVLLLQEEDAQHFLNNVQDALDKVSFSDGQFNRRVHRLLVKLSEICDKIPSSLFITGVHAEIHTSFRAIKRMRIFQTSENRLDIFRRFYKEALVWRRLKHPHVLPLLGIDADTFPRFLCMVSPFMQHGTLLKHMEANGNVNADRYLRQTAGGLEYLHSQGVVHGDLRGANVLVDNDWNIRLADFGLTVFADATIVTHSSSGSGSTRWMAPELHDPKAFGLERPRSYASDVYAFACVCIEVYTGRPPFSCLSGGGVILAVVSGSRPDRPLGAPGMAMGNNLWNIVQSCWSHHPTSRPQISQVVQSLTETLHEESISQLISSFMQSVTCALVRSPSQ